MKKLFLVAVMALFATSCMTVGSGKKGVEVSWGGKTNMDIIHPEGMDTGFKWLASSVIEYDVREKTLKEKYEFNDKNNMLTGVELALDYHLDPERVNVFHVKIGKENLDIKLQKTLQSAAKEVVPQYTATELNIYKREEAEAKLTAILKKELPELYVTLARVNLTDVDVPKAIAQAAEATAKQQELNKLALEKATEAENNFIAAEWDAKTKDILSQPAMLKLKELELQENWIKKWNGSFGNNNVFGAEGTSILKGMK